jgi:hypothetical protein
MNDFWHFNEYIEAWKTIIFIPLGWIAYLLLKLFYGEIE